MALSDPINLRLSIDRKRQYEDDAVRRGMPLTTYLRHRLEEGDQVNEQLAELRRLILDAPTGLYAHESSPAGEAASNPSAVPNAAMLVEVLLLLRSVVDADKMRMVHGELRRQGLAVWTGEKEDRTEDRA